MQKVQTKAQIVEMPFDQSDKAMGCWWIHCELPIGFLVAFSCIECGEVLCQHSTHVGVGGVPTRSALCPMCSKVWVPRFMNW